MKRLALVAAVAIAFLATGAQAVDSFAVHLVSQTNSTITLGWSPQPGYGYLFTADGVLRSRTNDPNRSTVQFSKQYSSFDIDVVTKGANGHYPVVTPPPPKAQCEDGVDNDGDGKVDLADPGCSSATDNDETNVVVPPVGVVPPLSSVGPSGQLTSRGGGTVSGTMSNVRFTGEVNFAGSSSFSCTNCAFDGGISSTYPNHGPITLSRCSIDGGWWFEDQNGVGGHDKVTLDHCRLNGGQLQAMRPKGTGTIRATDTWFMSAGQPPAGTHTEAVQVMWGGVFICERCAFSRQPVSNNTVTAVFTFEGADDGHGSTFTDCEFGYFNGTSWSRGGGFYQIYPTHASWIRPIIHSDPAGAWYSIPDVLVNPTYIP